MKLLSRILIAIILFLLLSLLFTGCLYTKKAAIRNFCSQDTATTTITVRDTVIIDRITSDTVFATSVDSVVIEKDKLIIRYQKIKDKIYLSGEYRGDTTYIEKTVKVSIPCNCRIATSYSLFEWVSAHGSAYKYALLFTLLFIVLLIVYLSRR